jgi:D-amino peptidase
MVAGDDILASDLEETMPAVKTVAVKKAISRHQAVHDSPDSVYEQLEAGAREALQQKEELPPYRFETPTTIELVFKHPTYAELAEMVPLCERTGLNTVAFTGEDYAGELYPAFCSMCGISAIAYYQGS